MKPEPANFAANLQKDTASKEGAVLGLAFSPDGRILTRVGEGQTICAFDVKTGQRLRQLGEQSPLTELPERRRSLSLAPLTVASCTPFQLAWSPDGKRVAQAWGRGMIR